MFQLVGTVGRSNSASTRLAAPPHICLLPLLYIVICHDPPFHFSSIRTMASSVANTVRDIGNSAAGAINGMAHNKKIADLERNKKDQHTSQNTTTDFGAKVSTVDNWLKVVDNDTGKIGPSLLEDEVARERVSHLSSPSRQH
jgi:hypothetical protein